MNATESILAFTAKFFTVSTEERDTLVEAFETAPVGSLDQAKAEVALYKFDLAHARDKASKRLAVKEIRLSEKGGINILGLRRFPINLYVAELEAIVNAVNDGTVLRFLETHKAQLSTGKAADAS